ncbi:transporter substrate-binding domain-containing protein [Pseudoalteromonas sp. MMG005]|nr:transporter substrate-binding domain-containing protein [Pseudoalteromonas sp. MMG005]
MAAMSERAVAKDLLRLATHDAYPYHYIENGSVKGTVIRQIKCAFNRLETPYRAEFSDWVDVELRLRTGNLDGIFAVAQSEARSEFGQVSVAVAAKHLYWYFAGNKIDIETTNPLYQRYKVAAEFGSDEWLDLKRKSYNVRMKPRNARALVQLLLSHEVDAILLDEHEFEHEIAKLRLQDTVFSRTEHGTIDLGVLFSKAFLNDRPTFLDAFNTAVSNCIVPNSGSQ